MADWFTENAPPTPDEAQMLAQIRAREAGGDYSARNPKPGSTASGAYQFTSSTVSPTWQLATKATGVPAYPSAAEAPPAIQDANALYMLRKHGPNATITWAASGPYKQPRNQGGANRAQDDGQAASSDVLSRLATGDVSPDELAQYLQPTPQAPSAAPAVQSPAPAGPVQPGDWFAKNAPPPKPPAPPPPSALDEAHRLGSIVAGSSGLTAVKDILAGGTKAAMDFLVGNPVNPQDVQQFKSAAGGILGGIAGEPERMRQQLIKSGDAMIHGDINSAADHLWFSLPFAGAAGERMAERLKSGDIKGAFADAVGSLLPFAAEPAISGTKAAIEAAPEAAATAATAAKGAAIGAGKAAIETVPLKRLGVEIQIPKPLATGAATSAGLGFAGVPHPVGFAIGAASPIIKGAFTGAREALAERMAANLPVPPEVGITPEVLPPLQLGPGPIITPPPPDPSFVRAVPAEYPYVEHPMVRAARQAGDLTPQEQALADHILQNVESPPRQPPVAPAAPEAPAATQEPSAAPSVPEAPQTLQPAAAVQKLTDYVLGKKIAPHMIDRLPPEYWQMIADDAGTAVPTADEIAQIKANVAAKAVETPVQGEQVFETQKARIEEGMTPPKETPPSPAGGGRPPMPEGIPAHYQWMYDLEGETPTGRAFLKDQRVADYLLGKGITPEAFAAKTLEEQNKLILEAPTKSGKGSHRAYKPKPEGEAVRSEGRWAHEGINDLVNTMRWRQAQTPAAPEAAVPAAGLEPWQVPKAELVPYSETLPRPKIPHDPSGGYTEAEINARALRNRAAEAEPPDITRHPVGSWGTDATGELMQLREYSLDDPKLIFTEAHGKNPTVRKYMEWIKEGNEPPPLLGLETEKGNIKIQQGNHRAIAIRETGGDKVKVWTVITRNRPIGGGQVMGEGLTHEAAVKAALAEGKPVSADVLADYPHLGEAPAAIPTEGLENTPIAGKAGFEAEKAKPAPAKRTRRAKARGEL